MLRWPFRKIQPPNADPELARTRLGAMRENDGLFAGLSGARILLYWPHGLGDWVHLGAILPLLEPSNRYAITRFGDDYVSVMEGNAYAVPLRSGVRPPGDGSAQGAQHLGMRLALCDGGKTELALPPPLDEAVMAFAPEALLWTDYRETEGRTAYPYHTKARNLARALVASERLRTFDLSRPLPNTVDFTAPQSTAQALDERLRAFAPPGSRIAVLSRTGFTAARKNWGDGTEAREFVATLRRDDERWRVISMDDDALGEGAAGFRALFGDLDEPFARVYKALAARADLFAGVPAGPLHLTMARGGVPVVGLWLAHHPDWYDEPNPSAIHLVGRHVRDRNFHRRPASTTLPDALKHRLEYLDTETIPATAVLEAARLAMR
ncbi:MAG: hypothetical protein JO199_00655 [Candidatus Eremiobacteraeota bacterium]|nr:hypothetical protein [Candidatus Eremiobacteraeota bacterium]